MTHICNDQVNKAELILAIFTGRNHADPEFRKRTILKRMFSYDHCQQRPNNFENTSEEGIINQEKMGGGWCHFYMEQGKTKLKSD